MKTWFKRKFPMDWLEGIKQGSVAFDFTQEILRAYAHIEKTEALLARAELCLKQGKIKFAPTTTNSDVDILLADFREFKGGE